jgi:UDP-GlcNAc3NAcA epimerase
MRDLLGVTPKVSLDEGLDRVVARVRARLAQVQSGSRRDNARLLTVVGARPQFVKAMPVSRAIARAPGLAEVMVHTGQHHDAALSDSFFRELDLPEPAENLGIHGGSHGEMTGRMLAALDGVIARVAPDLVIVYGDTNSTLAGALAAAKAGVPVAHVEAGLRVFDRTLPEETNRVVVDHLSRLLFAPTRAAVATWRARAWSRACCRSAT